jgi:hypothetical protein
MPEAETLVPHEPDHVIATQHGGATALENLAYACFQCNRAKGPNLASLDPETGLVTPLYNPRADRWDQHFRLHGALVEPVTPVGRTTVFLLRLNDSVRVTIRGNLLERGRYSPPSSR